MKRQSFNEKKSKVWLYALLIAFILGASAVVLQDIKIPTEHISKNIEVTLDK